MAGMRALLRWCSTPRPITGWRGVPLLALVAAIVIAVPQARALLTVGLLGGVVLGVFLILIRYKSGPPRPRRGTPVVLFPRQQTAADGPTYGFGRLFSTSASGLGLSATT